MHMPRLVVAGLSGGTGKTTVSLGLARIFARHLRVAPFKKGPDYIDTAWLGLAAGTTAGNLDAFFLDEDALRAQFCRWSSGADMALIEGNRGFFDGRDLAGSCSTAELARQLAAPVVLVVDCTKMTRTTAALVAGCRNFPGGGAIAGVILNRSGSKRHAALARQAVEELAQTPVLGVLPRLDDTLIVERRQGLVTVESCEGPFACGAAEEILDRIAALVADHVDTDALLALARNAVPLDAAVCAAPLGACALDLRSSPAPLGVSAPLPQASLRAECREEEGAVTIGVVRDAAIWQYYAENLEALRDAGARLVPVSLLDDAPWAVLDGLYLGGGDLVPYAAQLAQSLTRKRVADMAAAGLPMYAEQAGFFFLGQSLTADGVVYPLAGVFPVELTAGEKHGSLGYVEATVMTDTPFYAAGRTIRGHAYYYGTLEGLDKATVFTRSIGSRWGHIHDGFVRHAVLGTCMQIFAPAVQGWASSFVRLAAQKKAAS